METEKDPFLQMLKMKAKFFGRENNQKKRLALDGYIQQFGFESWIQFLDKYKRGKVVVYDLMTEIEKREEASQA